MAIKKHNSLRGKLDSVEMLERKIRLQKADLIEKAMSSTDPNVIMKANEMLQVQERTPSDRKSYIFDPNEFNSSMGYKDKAVNISYDVLRRMSYIVPVIRSIINTRIDQVCTFCEPQKDKYSTGFIIRKKVRRFDDASKKPTKEEIKTINYISDFILNCGVNNNFEGHDFDEFSRMVLNDSLTFDQLTFEIIRDRRGKPHHYLPVDGSTMRIADTFDDDEFKVLRRNFVNQNSYNKKVRGYLPSYVQTIDQRVHTQFYPWEMCFGIRNPTTSIYSNGYGISEIETLVTTVTSMLYADDYNRRFFSQGSQPKGFIRLKNSGQLLNNGQGSNSNLSNFKQKWQSMMTGVNNSHKIPIIEADAEWVDLQKTNREMEFSNWYEFLIKICCAIWRIDPAEINFPLGGGANDKAMFEGNNEGRLKHSKDKGLTPLIKFYQAKLNKYLVSQIDPDYELVFLGLEDIDPAKELERETKEVSNFKTVDEVRIARGDKPLGEENGGNLILNSVWFQWYNAKQMAAQQAQQNGGIDDGSYDASGSLDEQSQDEDASEEPQDGEEDDNENPFEKAFNSYLEGLIKSN